MKKSHFITATLIFSTLTLTSVDAAKRTMPSSSALSKTSTAKSTGTKRNSKAAKASTSKKKTSAAESQTSNKKSADKQVAGLTSAQQSKLLNLLNEGTGKELNAINGVAKTRSEAIVKARPYKEIGELILVKGIGKTTFAGILDHAKSLPRKKSTNQKSSSGKSKSKKVAAS